MENKVSLLQIKKTITTKLELAREIIRVYITLHNKQISDTNVTILAYFMVYGITNSTKDLIIRSEVVKNLSTLKSAMTILKKNDLIYKDDLNGKNYVNNDLKIVITPTVGIYIKLNIDNNEY